MKFHVKINRIGYASKTIEVYADSQERANELALDEAGDHEYNEHTSDYELDDAPSQEATMLEKIYHEIDRECISETDTVTMATISKIFEKYGANPKNME